MDRILQGVSATLSQTVLVDETGTDPSPDVATVTITRADGTPVVTNAAAINGANGGFQYVLTPLQTALLDRLRVDWTFTLSGLVQTLTTYVEIVGGYHVGLAEMRRLDPLGDQVTYTTAKLAEARTLAETVIEDATGQAFVPRYYYGQIPQGWPAVPHLRGIRTAVDADGYVLQPSEELELLRGTYPLRVWRGGRWTLGYEYGMDVCPPDVSRATAILARSYLLASAGVGASGFDERATSVVYSDAGLTYSTPLVTAGVRGAATSIPEVNSVIDRWSLVPIS